MVVLRRQPTKGTIMSGLRPFLSDHGPKNRTKKMLGIVLMRVPYIVKVATWLWTLSTKRLPSSNVKFRVLQSVTLLL